MNCQSLCKDQNEGDQDTLASNICYWLVTLRRLLMLPTEVAVLIQVVLDI